MCHFLRKDRTMESDSKMILACREKSLLGEDVRYILFAAEKNGISFYVTVEYSGDSVTIYLGSSINESVQIFNALCDGTVTPCTATDVVSDMQYSDAL